MNDNASKHILCLMYNNACTMQCILLHCCILLTLLSHVISSAKGTTNFKEQHPHNNHGFRSEFWGDYHSEKWRSFPDSLRLECKEGARKMFFYGYDSYMKYAFPQDELNPIACTGRGPDVLNP